MYLFGPLPVDYYWASSFWGRLTLCWSKFSIFELPSESRLRLRPEIFFLIIRGVSFSPFLYLELIVREAPTFYGWDLDQWCVPECSTHRPAHAGVKLEFFEKRSKLLERSVFMLHQSIGPIDMILQSSFSMCMHFCSLSIIVSSTDRRH